MMIGRVRKDPKGLPWPERKTPLYGRKHGRPLRPRQQALLNELLPALSIPEPAPGTTMDPALLFPAPVTQLWLEIGFGAGEHLVWQAARHPDVGFLGAEIFLNGVARLLRQVEEGGHRNLRILVGDGRALLKSLPDEVLGRVFILFPDPWPKARHNRRRILQEETLDWLARAMCPGAELRIATDHQDYLLWILQRLRRHPAFAWPVSGPDDWRRRPADWPATRYEEKAIAGGRTPVYLRWQRCWKS